MAYFTADETVRIGSSTEQLAIVVGQSWRETRGLYHKINYMPGVRLREPPQRRILGSKIAPRILMPADLVYKLGVEVNEVPRPYVELLSWINKQDFAISYGLDEYDGETRKKFDYEIRAKLILLLKSGKWIDEEEDDPVLENLHAQIKKIDRGRRSDLNYSSKQSLASSEKSARFSKDAFKERELERRLAKKEHADVPSKSSSEPEPVGDYWKWKAKKHQGPET